MEKSMKQKRILVILAHSSSVSFGSSLAQEYMAAAMASGHEVRTLILDQLQFDPILHQAFHRVQTLEPDLIKAQSDLMWAEHICWVYPIWWGGMPALMKGFIDRTFLPGFAFKYEAGKKFPKPLLKGRTAQLIVTMDTPPWFFRWFYRAPGIAQMQKTILEFCGVRPVKVLCLGPIIDSTLAQRQAMLSRVKALI
jgi:NAD(P)H dehydrogenase (quinone)